jgi:hypothetical protein
VTPSIPDVEQHPEDTVSPFVSVIVPVTERPYPLGDLYAQFSLPLKDRGLSFEFIFVMDERWKSLEESLLDLKASGEPVRILETGQPIFESAMLKVAASYASASRLLTLPSYPRVQPEALVQILKGLDRGFDLVSAARINRSDALVNRAQRRAFHFLLRKLVGGRLKDVASGVRAMRREVLEGIDLYGDSFRFIPFLALQEGFQVTEVEVDQHPDDRKTRVYSPGVYLRRLIDVLGLMFLTRFAYKPLRFFGLIGSFMATVGTVMFLVLFLQKMGGQGIADRPLLLLAVLFLVLGIQAVAMGLIGEIIVHQNPSRRRAYRLLGGDGGLPGRGSVIDSSGDTPPTGGSGPLPGDSKPVDRGD